MTATTTKPEAIATGIGREWQDARDQREADAWVERNQQLHSQIGELKSQIIRLTFKMGELSEDLEAHNKKQPRLIAERYQRLKDRMREMKAAGQR